MDDLKRWVTEQLDMSPDADDVLAAAEKRTAVCDSPAKALFEIGIELFGHAASDPALKVLESAAAKYTAVGDEAGTAACQRSMGAILLNRGRYDDATRVLESALRTAERIGDVVIQSGCLANIGASYSCRGDFRHAIEFYRRGMELAETTNSPLVVSRCCLGLGSSHFRLGEFDEAVRHLERGVAVGEANGDRVAQASCLTNLGSIYDILKDFTRAFHYHEKAMGIFQQIGDCTGQAACYVNMGLACTNLGHPEKSIEPLRSALKLYRSAGDPAGESKVYNDLGIAYFALGDYPSAASYYQNALAIKVRIGDRDGERICSANLGETYDRLGDFPNTLRYYGRALELLKETGDAYGTKTCLTELGNACFERADFVRSAEFLGQAAVVLNGLRQQHVPREYRSAFWRDNVALFDSLVASEVKLGMHHVAVEHTELAKGRTVVDFATSKSIGRDEAPSALTYERIRQLAGWLGTVIVLLRVTRGGTYAFIVRHSADVEVLDFHDFSQSDLDNLLVSYLNGRPAGGWVHGYSLHKLCREEACRLSTAGRDADAGAVFRNGDKAWFDTMDETLRRLDEALLRAVFAHITPGTKVVLIPNRALNVLPLHACFREENGQRRYLLDDYEITYAPNCNILDLCQKRAEGMMAETDGAGPHNLFAVANPAPPYELVFSEWEVDEIARHFERKEVLVKAESKQALLERGRHATVLHLSTHGIHDIGSSFNSRLKLGKDEELNLEEVFEHLRLEKNWLVCLSACESGLLDYRDIADEFIGLQAGFLYAGAPTVIASLWSIADYTTALVMMKLYENIYQRSMTKAAALRQAQLWLKDLTAGEALKLLKAKEEVLEYSERMAREDIAPVRRAVSLHDPNSKPFSHPYFWAGYQLFGV